MTLTGIALPKPKDWQHFERSIRTLFEHYLSDPNTMAHGRQGQKQAGVDVYGRRNGTGNFVGVQCKQKLEKAVSEAELKREVNKAKSFTPPLDEFILVTTAPSDQKIQSVARQLNSDESIPFQVYVWGWGDIETHASKHVGAWEAFDPTWNPFAAKAHTQQMLEMQSIKEQLALITGMNNRELSSQTTKLPENQSDENTPLHGQITVLQDMIEDGQISIAISQLVKTKDKAWNRASRSEKFRMLVALSSGFLKLGQQEEAGKLLLEAVSEYPDHSKARQHKATGLLLTKQFEKAEKTALQALNEEDRHESFASVLIQSRQTATSKNQLVKDIPEELKNTDQYLAALIHMLRKLGNSDWIKTAQDAYRQYPDDKHIKIFFAEAILELVTEQDIDGAVGGNFRVVTSAEFENAVEILHNAAKESLDNDNTLAPYNAHNASLALRLSDNKKDAIKLLDSAITKFPDEESLCLQRAIIAHEQNDYAKILQLLPPESETPEAQIFRAVALALMGKSNDALDIADLLDETELSEEHLGLLLSAKFEAWRRQKNEKALAVEIQRVSSKYPHSIRFKLFGVKLLRLNDKREEAESALHDIVLMVNESTPMTHLIELAYEADALQQYKIVKDLLYERVCRERDSDALRLLVIALANGKYIHSITQLLKSLPEALQKHQWYQRVDTILAINTGSKNTLTKIISYLNLYPDDIEMIIAKVQIFQNSSRESEIAKFLQSYDPEKLTGTVWLKINLCALFTHYIDARRGLYAAYHLLLKHWSEPQAHLAYQGLFLLNEHVSKFALDAQVVAEDTTVRLKTESGEQIYCIEDIDLPSPSYERIKPNEDLAKLLIGKKVGDEIENIGTILEIKTTILDAFQRSISYFNQRFPNAEGMLSLKMDFDSEDPLADMREITKARAERSQKMVDMYKKHNIPLCFLAAMMQENPLNMWQGLHEMGADFRVCTGLRQERIEALHAAYSMNQSGCVVDPITLSVIYRLKLKNAIEGICGKIHITQSTLDLLSYREKEAEHAIGRQTGFVGYKNDQLYFEEYTAEFWEKIIDERKNEKEWAITNTYVVDCVPQEEFSEEMRKFVIHLGIKPFEAAIAAQSYNMLLLTEDFGYRVWAIENMKINSTWLQPILISARDKKLITIEQYCDAINMLAISGHAYTSLDTQCFLHQLRKDNFTITSEVQILLKILGGENADLESNTNVAARLIDALWQENCKDYQVLRVASEIFSIFSAFRINSQQELVFFIINQCNSKINIMKEHAVRWLAGHSIGTPKFKYYVDYFKK